MRFDLKRVIHDNLCEIHFLHAWKKKEVFEIFFFHIKTHRKVVSGFPKLLLSNICLFLLLSCVQSAVTVFFLFSPVGGWKYIRGVPSKSPPPFLFAKIRGRGGGGGWFGRNPPWCDTKIAKHTPLLFYYYFWKIEFFPKVNLGPRSDHAHKTFWRKRLTLMYLSL